MTESALTRAIGNAIIIGIIMVVWDVNYTVGAFIGYTILGFIATGSIELGWYLFKKIFWK